VRLAGTSGDLLADELSAESRVTCIKLPSTMSSRVLDTVKDGGSATSLGNLLNHPHREVLSCVEMEMPESFGGEDNLGEGDLHDQGKTPQSYLDLRSSP